MNNKRSRHYFLIISIPFALSYWLFDSAVHYFGYGELEFEVVPSDFNELWMRAAIFILLIAFGIFADYHTTQIIKKEHEKHDLYLAMLNATNHILNNFLNNMILFRDEAESSLDFDKEMLLLYDQVIDDTVSQVKNLEGLQELNRRAIEKKYRPTQQ